MANKCHVCKTLGTLPYRKGVCNTCYQRSYSKNHYTPGKTSEWAIAHPERIMWLGAKHRAKQQSLPFTIETSDIVVPEKCPILGIRLNRRGESRYCAPSLDKVVSELGYVPGNVAVISNRANRMKSDSTLDELRKIVAYMSTFAAAKLGNTENLTSTDSLKHAGQ